MYSFSVEVGNVAAENLGDNRPAVYQEDGAWIFRASSIGSCATKLALIASGEVEVHSAKTLNAFRLGHEHEEIVKDRLTRAGVVYMMDQLALDISIIDQPTDTRPKVFVRGHIDGTIKDCPALPKFGLNEPVPGLALLEVKSMYGPGFDNFLATGLKDYPGYETQVKLYAFYLSKWLGKDVPVIFAAQCKEDLRLNIQVFRFTQDELLDCLLSVQKKALLVISTLKSIQSGIRPKCIDHYDQKFSCPFEEYHAEDPERVTVREIEPESKDGQWLKSALDRNAELGIEIANSIEEQKRLKKLIEQAHKKENADKLKCGEYTIRFQKNAPSIDREGLRRDYPEIARLEEQYKNDAGSHMRIDKSKSKSKEKN